VVGLLPPGAKVYFQVDSGPKFTDFDDGGVYDVPAGQHTLRAYIGDANGIRIPGTMILTNSFTVLL
jgi:hypothetical protein